MKTIPLMPSCTEYLCAKYFFYLLMENLNTLIRLNIYLWILTFNRDQFILHLKLFKYIPIPTREVLKYQFLIFVKNPSHLCKLM